MTQNSGVKRQVRWAWGLGVCLCLCSLGAGSVQAQINTRRSPPPASETGSSRLPSSKVSESTREAKKLPGSPPTPEQRRPGLPKGEGEVSPFSQFPLLKKLDPSPPTLADLGIHLEQLALLPDPELAKQMDEDFRQQLARLNEQIAAQQEQLYRLLQDWGSNEEDIRQVQAQLSALRTERDRLALEHLLMLRQLQDNFSLPLLNPSATSSP